MIQDSENEMTTSSENSSDSECEATILKRHKCSFAGCSKSFDRPSRLTSHMRSHTNERPFKCKYQNCGKDFHNKQSLTRHIQMFHLNNIENAMCPFEGCMLVMRKNSLHKHMLRKHNSLRKHKFQCSVCGKIHRSEFEMQQHASEHTDIFKCDICKKVFQKGYRFRAHLKIHNKNYECVCQESFTDFESFKSHEKTCELCLIRCDICNKTFKRKSNLKEHLKTHLVSIPSFNCTYEGCSRNYYQMKNLKQHIRDFHLKLPTDSTWSCDICQQIFKKELYLRRHKKNIHENPERQSAKPRKPRWDKGVPKLSMVTKLTGLAMPREENEKRMVIEKALEESK